MRTTSVRKHWLAVMASCTTIAVGLLATALPAAGGTAATSSPLSAMLLRASDVPGFHPVSPADENITQPNDYGQDQAFISCARGDVLLDQFDTGGKGALVGPFWGEGVSAFGTPELSIASVAFGDGSVTDAQRAEGDLARPAFQQCWASTTDALNAEQGVTVPIYNSTVQRLPAPRVGGSSTAFAINSTYGVLGRTVQFQWDVAAVQKGAYVVMLVAAAFTQAFPLGVLDRAAGDVQARAPQSAPPVDSGAFVFKVAFGEDFNARVASSLPLSWIATGAVATVSWGDGSVSTATLRTTGPTTVSVYASHTYWVTGKVPVTVTVSDGRRQEAFQGTAIVTSTYTAMGDSYSAGEGSDWQPGALEPAVGGGGWWMYRDPTGHLDHGSTDYLSSGHGDMCHRSITAYAHVVYRLLAVAGMTMNFVACSGAILTDMYSPASVDRGDKYQGEAPQVDALSPSTSLVTLTMGGNNLKFAGVATNCVEATLSLGEAECLKQDASGLSILGYNTSPGSNQDGTYTPYTSATGLWAQTTSTAGMTLSDLYNWSVGTAGTQASSGNDLHDAFVLMLREIKSRAPGARILVLGYPRWFPPSGSGGICSYFTNHEQLWINNRIQLLDMVIEDAVDESGVAQYVPVYDAVAGHEECNGLPTGPGSLYTVSKAGVVSGCSGNYINPVAALGGALGSPELLHPNPCGHLAEAKIVAAAYQRGIPGQLRFSLPAGTTRTFTFHVPASSSGRPMRANFSVQLATQAPSGTLQWHVTSPGGRQYQPVQQGPVYATWDIPNPAPGAWFVTVASTAPHGTGSIEGAVWQAPPALVPRLPPAGEVHVISHSSCFLSRCTDTFRASTNGPPGSVSGYYWYDDKGNFIGGGSTASMTSNISSYKLILRTNGYGNYRYTVYNCGDNSCSVEGS